MPSEISRWSVLKNLSFIQLWFSQLLAYLADRFNQMALLGLFLISASHSKGDLAYLTFFNLLPHLLLGQIAGILSDRFSRRLILIYSDLIRAISIGLVPLLLLSQGEVSGWKLYLISFLIGCGTAFYSPTKLAYVPDLVKPEDLPSANALNASTSLIATLIGSLVGGILFERIGAEKSFLLNSLAYILSALFLFSIKPSIPISSEREQETKGEKSGFDFRAAWLFLKRHKRAKDVILLSCGLSFLSSLFYIGLSEATTQTYHLGTSGLGRLLTMLGIGMILGAVSSIYLTDRYKPIQILLVCFSLICLLNATSGLVTSFTFAWFWLIGIGCANSICLVLLDTLLQKSVPNFIRGKIFGFRAFVSMGAFLIALLLVGQFLKFAEPLNVFKIISVVSLLVGLIIVTSTPNATYLCLRYILYPFALLFFQVNHSGRKYIPVTGQVILAGNHTGWLDTIALGIACHRPIVYLASAKVISWLLVGWVMRAVNVIPVVDGSGRDALDGAVRELGKGKVLGIFPEGMLTRDGNLNRFRRGVIRIQKLSGAPIVPFAIHGGFEAWSWNSKLPKPGKISVAFGEPIQPAPGEESSQLDLLHEKVKTLKLQLTSQSEKTIQSSIKGG
ncbi:MAG: MFS transporter [Candidatus Caenarcaniphilales bacterium]|nr:MFS transporter [Candidatus Caenarcaniphilales bacterium]